MHSGCLAGCAEWKYVSVLCNVLILSEVEAELSAGSTGSLRDFRKHFEEHHVMHFMETANFKSQKSVFEVFLSFVNQSNKLADINRVARTVSACDQILLHVAEIITQNSLLKRNRFTRSQTASSLSEDSTWRSKTR